jgi:hypothetical protein
MLAAPAMNVVFPDAEPTKVEIPLNTHVIAPATAVSFAWPPTDVPLTLTCNGDDDDVDSPERSSVFDAPLAPSNVTPLSVPGWNVVDTEPWAMVTATVGFELSDIDEHPETAVPSSVIE